MRYLGLDLGTKTLGVSISDESLTIANPLTIIRFSNQDYESTKEKLLEIITDYNISKIVLGLPKNMNNSIGFRGEETLKYKELLTKWTNLEIIMQDERLTTVQATNYMLEADISRKKRKKKIDSLAANIILQTYLDREKGKEWEYGSRSNDI